MSEKTYVEIPSTDGAMGFEFSEEGVRVIIYHTECTMTWADWGFLAKVYGKRGSRADDSL